MRFVPFIGAALAKKVLHGWMQNRYQTRYPLALNLRNNTPEETALLLQAVHHAVRLTGPGADAVQNAARFVAGAGGVLGPAPDIDGPDLIEQLHAARLASQAYALCAGALGRRTMVTRRFLDFLDPARLAGRRDVQPEPPVRGLIPAALVGHGFRVAFRVPPPANPAARVTHRDPADVVRRHHINHRLDAVVRLAADHPRGHHVPHGDRGRVEAARHDAIQDVAVRQHAFQGIGRTDRQRADVQLAHQLGRLFDQGRAVNEPDGVGHDFGDLQAFSAFARLVSA